MKPQIFAFCAAATAVLFNGCAGQGNAYSPVAQAAVPSISAPSAASVAQGAVPSISTPSAASVAQAVSAGLPTVDMAAVKALLSPDEIAQTVEFPETGTKTLSGRIEGYKTASFAVPVRKGQKLDVTMETKSSSAYFNIQDVKDTSGAAVFAGETEGTNTAMIRAQADTTYVIRPYLVRAVARRGEKADYTFKIERQ
ncbi:hypothetical protein [Methyloterricola oryzae]|uniref:hypothetical protein n=1 Tax=Methyloterricola oryzae TaxID=1495050 RepID=UPI0005EBDA17|nr:hypothetical protein [Methyloterricola oryzae]